MLLAAAALACSTTPTIMIVGVVLLGILYARNLEFMHAALHGGLLPGGRANRIVGALLGAPMLVSFSLWRAEHAQHHRDVRDEGFAYEYDRLNGFFELLLHLFMVRHLWRSIQAITRFDKLSVTGCEAGSVTGCKTGSQTGCDAGSVTGCKTGSLTGSKRLVTLRSERSERLEGSKGYLASGAFVLLLALLSALTRHPYIVTLWLLPLPIACIAHTFIELPEHFGRLTTSGDPFVNSRIVRASKAMSWFVLYNNFHAMHHAKPSLPIHLLPEAYATSRSGLWQSEATYLVFYRSLLGFFLTGRWSDGIV
ncbi:MAG: fatty acid desaturase family protein [Vulcanimicrobiaceae bacterium]